MTHGRSQEQSVTTDVGLGIEGEVSMHRGCGCFIVPPYILERFADDTTLTAEERQSFANAVRLEALWRRGRSANVKTARLARQQIGFTGASATAVVTPPVVSVFDCQHRPSLPGIVVPNPQSSGDATVRRVHDETTAMSDFLRTIFGRNSLDDAGMGLLSSVHYGTGYNNAFWNGVQMTYGDGDGAIFLDFTLSTDVIAHELSHGLTQFTGDFAYANEPGGLNESMSDVFGSMFRQWRAGQTSATADWLIGKDIMGPKARERGFRCLRDMANPSATHCLAPQPDHYSKYVAGMDPHDSSGIPNVAFHRAAIALGGNSWDQAGQVWYQALTGFAANPSLQMSAFAKRTRSVAASAFAHSPQVLVAVDQAWVSVGL